MIHQTAWRALTLASCLCPGYCPPVAAQQSTAPPEVPATAPSGAVPTPARGAQGPTVAVTPLAGAMSVEKAPPLDKNGNFKVSLSGRWSDVPALTVPDHVPRGKVTMFSMKSEDSKMYPGARGPY